MKPKRKREQTDLRRRSMHLAMTNRGLLPAELGQPLIQQHKPRRLRNSRRTRQREWLIRKNEKDQLQGSRLSEKVSRPHRDMAQTCARILHDLQSRRDQHRMVLSSEIVGVHRKYHVRTIKKVSTRTNRSFGCKRRANINRHKNNFQATRQEVRLDQERDRTLWALAMVTTPSETDSMRITKCRMWAALIACQKYQDRLPRHLVSQSIKQS